MPDQCPSRDLLWAATTLALAIGAAVCAVARDDPWWLACTVLWAMASGGWIQHWVDHRRLIDHSREAPR